MIDVVIPLYNGAAWIEETLASVFQQSVRPARVIVVDDGSTDDSLERVARFAGVEVVANSGKGPSAARNFGLAMSTAPYMAFLDHDDIWHKDHLRYLLEAYKIYPDAGMVLSRMTSFTDGRKAHFDLSDCSYEVADAWEQYPQNVYAGTPGLFLFRRDLLVAEGGWPEAHWGAVDYSIILLMSINRPLILFMGETLAYRRHRHSRSKVMFRTGQKDWLHQFTVVNGDLMQAFVSRSADKVAAEKIRRRYSMFVCVKQMVQAFCDPSLLEFQSNRRQLEELMQHEPRGVQRRFVARFWRLARMYQQYKGKYSRIGFFVLKTVTKIEQRMAALRRGRQLLPMRVLECTLAKRSGGR